MLQNQIFAPLKKKKHGAGSKMLEIIGAVLKILQMLLGKWFEFSSEKKQEAKEILSEVKDAKDTKSIVRIFDRVNRL